MGDGADNDGTPVPTIMTGTYDLHSCYHLGKYRAFELKEPGKESVPVIRKTGISTSNYINVHGRDMIDKNPTSTGCITILRNEFHKILLTVGLESSDFANRKRQGAMVIDRSYISKKCQNYYKALYGEYYKYCFNTPEPVFTDIESHWCERIVISLKEKGIINGYPDGTMRPDQQPTRAEVFAIANNIIKYMEDK
ncbi:hypothetical protein MHBO_001922 [Bonamia ostreae]|uniref:SLH domain-containing protein n=1 Tax=Bonamia ostreae TaxID=126728 RepID=A0ABV2AKP4_9EUKA